jgi:hypothetical protein
MKALKSRRAQEPTRVDCRLEEKLASLFGGDLTSVSKARLVVARLDDETASRLDRVTEIKIKSLRPLTRRDLSGAQRRHAKMRHKPV